MLLTYLPETLTFAHPGTPSRTDPDGTATTTPTIVSAMVQHKDTLVRLLDGTTATATLKVLCPEAAIALGDTFSYRAHTYTVLSLQTIVSLGVVEAMVVYGG
jgi:hypothetical protein